MTGQRHESEREVIAQLRDDDAFLDSLALGEDPSAGADPLAALFVDAKRAIEADMPPVPTLAELGIELPEVDELAERRSRHVVGRFASGLIGAAAATCLIAGSGVAIFNASEGSPLYGLNQSIFGANSQNNDVMVELASTLEEVSVRAESGDIAGAQALLSEARLMVDKLNAEEKPTASTLIAETESSVQQTPPPVVTETVIHTQEVPVTVVPAPAPAPAPAPVATPSIAPPQAVTSVASAQPSAQPQQPTATTPAEPSVQLQIPEDYQQP